LNLPRPAQYGLYLIAPYRVTQLILKLLVRHSLLNAATNASLNSIILRQF